MYQTTKEFRDVIQQDSRMFHAFLTVDGSVDIDEGIRSFKINGGSNSESDFSIGSAVSRYVELEINNPTVPLEGHEIQVKIGAEIDGEMQYVPMGYFTCEKPKVDEGYISVTAYDRMLKMERACFLSIPDSTTTIAILNAISIITGVTIVTTGLASIAMEKPVGYTCREVLSFLSQIYGGFAICNRSGQIEIRTYTDINYTISTGRYWGSFQHNDYAFTLEKLTCFTGVDEEGNNISVSAGTGVREISFSNPFMTQLMLNNVWTKLNNYAYMPGTISFLGDPCIDPWDILTVHDRNGNSYKVPVMKLIQTFDGGFTTSIEAVGKSEPEQEIGFNGPSVTNQNRWNAELALINHAIINKLDVDTANIKFATIENLNAVNAHIQNLDADYGNFKELTTTELSAVKANISILDADTANIKSLLAGNAGIGDLQNIHLTTQNAVIDSAVIRLLLADIANIKDLIAGKIYTNDVVISSKDGGIEIFGSVQRWKDSQGNVRMQAGQDANGEFNYYVTDTSGNVMWNALGLTSDAIKDPIIKDSMVAVDADISGSKLDIPSVVTEINNGTTTIKSNLIYYDAENQTLDMVLGRNIASLTNVENHVTTIQTGLDGLKLDILETQTELKGLSNGNLLFNVTYTNNEDGTTTLTAHVYKGGVDATDTFPYTWFSWWKKSESINGFIEQGYSLLVNNEDSGLGGASYVGRFATRKQLYFTTKNSKRFMTKKSKYFIAESEEE